VEMTFFTSSTFPAENLNTGETEVCLGNSSFSSVSFLVFTRFNHNNTEKMFGVLQKSNQISDTYHPVGAGDLEGSSLGKESLGERVKPLELGSG